MIEPEPCMRSLKSICRRHARLDDGAASPANGAGCGTDRARVLPCDSGCRIPCKRRCLTGHNGARRGNEGACSESEGRTALTRIMRV